MLKALLSLSVALVAVPAFAQDAQALGFTQDGALFVVGRYARVDGDTIGSYSIFDTRSGQLEDEYLDPDQYEAWAAKHPLAPLKTGPRAPAGEAQLEAGKGGRWRKDGQFEVPGTWTWTGDPDSEDVPVPAPSRIRFSVKAGKKRWASADLRFNHLNVQQAVEPVWSPDGRRVAYLVHVSSACDMGGVDFDVAFGPVQGPRVQVLGVKGTPPESFTKVQAALEGAGFAPIADGEAKARHPTTVIFAAKGFEAEAKKAAAVLPDAKVDKLTWKPGYELVVVIGGR